MFLALVAAAVFAEVSLPRPLTIAVTWIARAGTAGAVVMGLIQTLYPVIPEAVIFGVSAVLAYVLVPVAAVLLLARMPPQSGVLPATFGALIAAFIQSGPSGLRAATGIAMVVLMAWLAVWDDERGAVATLRPLPLLVFALLSMAIAFGITQLLPWAQPQVEMALVKMISNDLNAEAGLSLESRLGDVEKLALSKRVALRVYGDRPEDLRVRTFTSFDGRAWRADPRPSRRLAPAPAPAGRWPGFDETPGTVLAEPARGFADALRSSRLVVRSPERGAMPAPAHTLAVKVEDVNVDQNPSGILIPAEKAALYDGFAALFAQGGVGRVLLVLGRAATEHPATVAIAVAAFLVVRFRKHLWRRSARSGRGATTPLSDPLRPEMRRLLAGIDARCAARGVPRPPSRGPLEHVSDERVPLNDSERSTCLNAVGVLYEEAYGGTPTAPRRIEDMVAALAAFGAAPAPPRESP
jgi:hypothetical protein